MKQTATQGKIKVVDLFIFFVFIELIRANIVTPDFLIR